MGFIEKLAEETTNKVFPIKQSEPIFDINKEVQKKYNITLSPINFPHKFIGRNDDIDNILEKLKTNNLMVIVNGIGGIGKTSVCKHMFHNCKEKIQKHYKHIAWVDYNKGLSYSFVAAFKELNIPFSQSDTLDIKFEKIISHINKLGDNLLIFIDNVDKTFRNDKNLNILLQLKNHIIITSRRKVFGDSYIYPLGFLSEEQCKELFLEHYKVVYDDFKSDVNSILPSIIKICGFHSLTIELIAKSSNSISNSGIKLGELKNLLLKSNFDLSIFNSSTYSDWDDRLVEMTISEHIKKVFSLSKLSKLQKDNLHKLSFLATSSLSISKVEKILNINEQHLNTLIDKGWISTDGENIQIHSCIKYALNSQLKQSNSKYEFILSNIRELLKWESNHIEIIDVIPHAEEICNKFKNRKSNILCAVQNNIATYFKYQGDFKTSINYMRKQMTTYKRLNQLKTLSCCQKDLATMYIELNNYNLALKYIKKSLYLRKKLYSPISFEIAECYAHIGYTYQEKGEYEKTLTNYRKALQIRKKLYGKDHPITAWSYNNLAMLYCHIFEYDKAIHFIDRAIEIRKKALTDKQDKIDKLSLDLAQSESIKGYILLHKGKYHDAEVLLESSLKIRKDYLGEKHLYTGTAYERFALAKAYLSFPHEAEDYILKAIAISQENSGGSSIRTALLLNTYAIVKRVQKLEEDALNLHKNAINMLSRHLGTKNIRLSTVYEDMANTQFYFNAFQNAYKSYKKCYTIYQTMKPYPSKKCTDIINKMKRCIVI